jgi:hypothetical protein
MDIEARLTTPAAPSRVLALVDDLSVYPQWMPLVHRAEQCSKPVVGVADAWNVELRAKVGPFARSKKLRMVRAVYERAERGGVARIVFERREVDERQHAMWRLTVTVAAADSAASGAELVMHLHYDGRLFVSVVEAILRQNIDAGRERLAELLAR